MGEEMKSSKLQRILVPLFTFFWWNRLWFENSNCRGLYHRGHVDKVKGWRTARLDEPGRGRSTITFCLKKLLIEFTEKLGSRSIS